MNGENKSNSLLIAKLNDEIRLLAPYLPAPHRFIVTERVMELSDNLVQELLCKIRAFNDFEDHNDPWEEHDFGAVKHNGEKYFFKFDYFDKNFRFFEENGVRVLTLMHASEY